MESSIIFPLVALVAYLVAVFYIRSLVSTGVLEELIKMFDKTYFARKSYDPPDGHGISIATYMHKDTSVVVSRKTEQEKVVQQVVNITILGSGTFISLVTEDLKIAEYYEGGIYIVPQLMSEYKRTKIMELHSRIRRLQFQTH